MKKETEEESLNKLVKLTKLMKQEKVRVAKQGPSKSNNKWRSNEPKFTNKTEKPSGLVQVGGMEVDPARQQEYENWQKDKLEEQAFRRVEAARKAKNARNI
jgi:hypothetical protein